MFDLDTLAPKYKTKYLEKSPKLRSQVSIIDKDGVLQRINIDITDRCNYKCKKCFKAEKVGADKNEMTFPLLINIIDEAVSLGVKEIGLHGGEPTLHDEFDAILYHFKKKYQKSPNFFTTLFTNGSHLYNSFNRRSLIKESDFLEVCFTIETFDKADYEERTRCPKNSFNTVIQNLEYALQDGLAQQRRLALTFTISKNNLPQINIVWKFCRETGIIPRFTFLVHEGRAKQFLSDEVLNDEEREKVKEQIIAFDKNLGYMPIVSKRAIGIKHFMAFNMIGINVDGTTNDFNNTISGLNVSELSLDKIWKENIKRRNQL